MATTLVIPDIHNDCATADAIMAAEEYDDVVLLGDYFDDFFDKPEDAERAARWLVESLEHKDRIHLVGNHDLAYMSDSPAFKCSGWTPAKHEAVRKVDIPWGRMRMWCWTNGWLCTHAGLTLDFFRQIRANEVDGVEVTLAKSWPGMEAAIGDDSPHPFFQAGASRRGNADVGGLLWCDYGDEFVDVPGVRQIFGHTRRGDVRHGSTVDAEHYCIDTGLANYALVNEHGVRVKAVRPGAKHIAASAAHNP